MVTEIHQWEIGEPILEVAELQIDFASCRKAFKSNGRPVRKWLSSGHFSWSDTKLSTLLLQGRCRSPVITCLIAQDLSAAEASQSGDACRHGFPI